MKQGSGELVDRIIPVLMSDFGYIAFFNVISSFVINEPFGLAVLNFTVRRRACARDRGFHAVKKLT